MSLYKRGRIWWVSWQIDGKPFAETTRTTDRAEAQEYHDQRRAELWRESRLDKKPVRTWDDACLAWLNEHAQHKRSYQDDLLRLRWINPRLSGLKLDSISTGTLTKLRDERIKDVARSTANRYLAIVSAILNHAHAKDWISAVPKVPYNSEPEGRIRYLTRDEAGNLLAELPPHLNAMARLCLATGLRRANITGLTWDNVDLGRRVAWIWADEAKGKKAITVPLNDAAVAVLQKQIGEHPQIVFPWRGAAIFHVKTAAWDKACARAGLKDVNFHTLRHTWASWHVMAGTPLEVLMKLGGWSRMEMVLRYAHLAPGYLSGYAGNVAGLPDDSATVSALVSEHSR